MASSVLGPESASLSWRVSAGPGGTVGGALRRRRRRNEQVGVGTVPAVNPNYDRVNSLHKLSWQLARLACPGKEFGSYLSGNGPILIHQIQRELALPTTKYQPRPDPRARALPLGP